MADYFHTSIDFIVGYTDIRRKIEHTEAHHLNPREAEFVARVRALSEEEKQCINLTMQTFLKK